MVLVSLALGLLTPPLLVRADDDATDEAFIIPPDNKECETHPDGRTTCTADTKGSHRTLFPCTGATLDMYMHSQPVPGYHVVCFSEAHNDKKSHGHFLQLTYYTNGFYNKTTTQTFPAPSIKWKHVKFALGFKLKLEMNRTVVPDGFQSWAIYTPLGQRVADADTDDDDEETGALVLQVLLKYQTLLIFEGGQFIWPGVRLGFSRKVNLYSIMPPGDELPDAVDKHREVTLHTMSLSPLVLMVDDFLSDEECDYIQTRAEPTMEYSGVVLMDHDQGRPASDFRTSQSTFVSARDDPTLLDVEYRTASLVRVPRQHQEDVQVLRYGPGEK